MVTVEELKAEFDILTQEETQIPIAINNIMNEITPIEEQIVSLRSQAQELDLQISEQPPMVFEKQCRCAFICIGKTCYEIPMQNPAIAGLVSQRNDLIRQSNELQKQVDEKAKEITRLGNRQIEVKTRLNEIRSQLITEQKQVVAQPIEIFKLETISKYLPYVLIGGGILGILVFTAVVKKRRRHNG